MAQVSIDLRPTFDIREQILENAHALRVMIIGSLQHQHKAPALEILTFGEGTSISAKIVQVVSNEKGQSRYIFIQGGEADSAEKALEKLLQVTMAMLNKQQSKHLHVTGEFKWNAVGMGGYYGPRK